MFKFLSPNCFDSKIFQFDQPMLFAIVIALGVMAASTLESEAAFRDRASQIGVEDRYIDKFAEKNFAAFGRYAFCVVYSPNHTDEAPLRNFLQDLLEELPGPDQMACLRRLFFESHTMALTDASELRRRRTRQWRPGSWPLRKEWPGKESRSSS